MHETDRSLPIPRLESSLYDDYESFLLPDVVDDTSLTDLEEVFNPPLTSLPLVTSSFSSIPVATNFDDSTLLASPPPFSSVHEVKMGETSRGDVSVLEDALLLRSK